MPDLKHPCALMAGRHVIPVLTIVSFLSFVTHGSSEMTFLTIGDWGKNGPPQTDVADAMAEVAARKNVSYVINVGDSFYELGVKDIHDDAWTTIFDNVYHQDSLQVPWYSVLGNHDWYRNAGAQIEKFRYDAQKLPRWVMPSFYFFTQHSIPATTTGTSDDIIVATIYIDTWITTLPYLCGIYEFERLDQLKWLDAILKQAQASADWIFVVGHHPVYSSGMHGDTGDLKREMLPMMRKYGVDVYFSGHDHHLEALEDDVNDYEPGLVRENPMLFILSGAGAKNRDLKEIHKNSLFATPDYGFTFHNLTRTTFYTEYIDDTMLSRFTITLKKSGVRMLSESDYATNDFFFDDYRRLVPVSPNCNSTSDIYTFLGNQKIATRTELAEIINKSASENQNPLLDHIPNSCMVNPNTADLTVRWVDEGVAKIYGRPMRAWFPAVLLLAAYLSGVAVVIWLCVKRWRARKTEQGGSIYPTESREVEPQNASNERDVSNAGIVEEGHSGSVSERSAREVF
eukprot:Selendium_serpulae@DN4838_c0_g1_i2.p1